MGCINSKPEVVDSNELRDSTIDSKKDNKIDKQVDIKVDTPKTVESNQSNDTIEKKDENIKVESIDKQIIKEEPIEDKIIDKSIEESSNNQQVNDNQEKDIIETVFTEIIKDEKDKELIIEELKLYDIEQQLVNQEIKLIDKETEEKEELEELINDQINIKKKEEELEELIKQQELLDNANKEQIELERLELIKLKEIEASNNETINELNKQILIDEAIKEEIQDNILKNEIKILIVQNEIEKNNLQDENNNIEIEKEINENEAIIQAIDSELINELKAEIEAEIELEIEKEIKEEIAIHQIVDQKVDEEIVNVTEKPIESDEAVITIPPAKFGFIWKEGQKYKSWNNRYFVLEKGVLAYYDKPSNSDPLSGVNKKGEIPSLKGKLIEIVGEFVLIKGGSERDINLKFDNNSDKIDWAAAIQEHITYCDKYNIEGSKESEVDSTDVNIDEVYPTTPVITSIIEVPLKHGYINKQGRNVPTWNLRYFVLEKGKLVYYEKATADNEYPYGVNEKGSLPSLAGVSVEVNGDNVNLTGGDDRTLLLNFSSKVDLDAWVDAFNSHIAYANSRQSLKITKEAEIEVTKADEVIDKPPIKYGRVSKQAQTNQRKWDLRQVVLSEGTLTYYKSALSNPPYGKEKKGEVPSLAGKTINILDDLQVELTGGSERDITLKFINETERNEWIQSIQLHINYKNAISK